MFDQLQRKATLATVAAAGVMLASSGAIAASIEGTARFGGPVTVFSGSDGSGNSVSNLTQGTSVVTDNTATEFEGGTGDFAGFSATSVNSFADFDYQPVDSSEFTPTFASFWSVTLGGDDYTMDVSSLTVSDIEPNQFDITGTGTLNSTDMALDPTPGVITGSFNEAGGTVNFSATSASAAIPAPATMALLGTGLIGLGLAVRRRAT